MQFFQINLEALQTKNPHLAQRLQSIDEVKDFEIFMDENDVKTLNFVHAKHFIPLYGASPAQTIQKQIEEFQKFAKYPYLYFYGLGNGVFLKHLLQNPLCKRVVAVEPELELLYVVLHMVDFKEELLEGRLVLLGFDEVTFPNARALFNLYQEQKYAKIYDLHIMSEYYTNLFGEHIQECNRRFIEGLYHAVNGAGNDAKDALVGLEHHIINLPKLFQTPPLIDLLNKLNTTDTAVLVSTGPSLTKQLPLLKEIAPYVRIIAVDASFPILYKAGIKPDVVVSMERVKESARFFQQVPLDGYEDVVIALSSLQHKEVIDAIKGGTLQISLRPLGYMMVSGPKEWGYMGIGTSAANMGFELIFYSKFKNCILIGQDLAYSDEGTSHAHGHVFGVKNVQTKETDVWTLGWGGEKNVRTNHNWTMFRNFFEKDLADIKDAMLTVNATEGGARIFGAHELSFAQAVQAYVKSTKQKEPLKLTDMPREKHEQIERAAWAKIEEITAYVKALLEETKELFLDVASASEKGEELLGMQELQELILRIERLKEKHQEEIFEQVLWHIAQSMLLAQEIDIAPVEVYFCEDETVEKERLYHLVHRYKSWLFSFAGIMDAILKTILHAKAITRYEKVKDIDVFIDNQKIDTLACLSLSAQKGRVFNGEVRGILYDVPDAYQGQIEHVVFKDAKSGEILPEAFVSVIRRDDAKYNELSFMKSLEEPIDEEVIKDLYCPNAIGFLATEENLEDEEFVGYIKELMIDFPMYHFKALIFNDQMKADVLNIFENKCMQICVINSVADMIENIEVYVSNNERNRQDTEVLYYLRKVSTDVLCMGLYLNQQSVTIEEQEKNNTEYFSKFFDNLEYLGFTKEDKAKYGESFHAIWYKKASETYNVPIDFDPKQSMVKAYLTWNLKLGFNNHEFFKYALDFAKKYARL